MGKSRTLANLTNTAATTTDVTTAINNLVAAAPGALDTLDELAAALGDDANFATTVTNNIAAKAPAANPTFTGTVTSPVTIITDTLKIEEVKEKFKTVAVTPTAEPNIEVKTGSITYFTATNTANFTLNFKGDVSTTMDTFLAIGEATTATILVTNGSTPYYANTIQIDGTTVTVKWLGGTAPAAGNASSIDAYSFTIFKTAANTYTVLGSLTKFA